LEVFGKKNLRGPWAAQLANQGKGPGGSKDLLVLTEKGRAVAGNPFPPPEKAQATTKKKGRKEGGI